MLSQEHKVIVDHGCDEAAEGKAEPVAVVQNPEEHVSQMLCDHEDHVDLHGNNELLTLSGTVLLEPLVTVEGRGTETAGDTKRDGAPHERPAHVLKASADLGDGAEDGDHGEDLQTHLRWQNEAAHVRWNGELVLVFLSHFYTFIFY